jgi:NAD-dependent dihydropyrimidine dehydrogenase PreA subunit
LRHEDWGVEFEAGFALSIPAVQFGFTYSPSGDRYFMTYVIAEPCIGTKDTACVDACPVDCIHPKKDEAKYSDTDQLFIDPVECIDCGACVRPSSPATTCLRSGRALLRRTLVISAARPSARVPGER